MLKSILRCLLLVGLISTPVLASGQAPSGATGLCGDGTYTFSATKRGACSKHGGIKQWLGSAAPAPAPRPDSTKTTTSAKTSTSSAKVWVNTPTMVYHCPGTRWYGTTKKGSYMTEADAKKAGARPAYGKPCSSP